MRIVSFVLGVLACGLTGPMARAANRVVVVDALQTTEKLRKEARAAINEALLDQSFESIPASKLGGKTCESSNCFSSLAKDSDALYTLVVQGTAGATGYRISLDLREGSSGRTLGSDSKECELCDAKDFRKAVRERTATLVTRVHQELAAAPPPIMPGPKIDEPPVNVKIEKIDLPVPPPTPEPVVRTFWQQPIPLIGLGLGAVGAGLLGTGVYYLAVDGKSASRSGDPGSYGFYKRDTGTFGWAMLGTGIAAMAGGTALVIWGRDSANGINLALSPQHIWLLGRF